MRDRDWFMLGCRLFGVWIAYAAINYLSAYLAAKFGPAEDFGRESRPGGLLIHACIFMTFALYLLLGTRHLAWLCFEKDEPMKGSSRAVEAPPERDLI